MQVWRAARVTSESGAYTDHGGSYWAKVAVNPANSNGIKPRANLTHTVLVGRAEDARQKMDGKRLT